MNRRLLPIVASLLLLSVVFAPKVRAGIISGEGFLPEVTSNSVSAQYTYDGNTDTGELRILGYADRLIQPSGSSQVFRGQFNPSDPDPVSALLHPNGNRAIEGVNVPLPFPGTSGVTPLKPSHEGLFRLDATLDGNGNLIDGSLVVHGSLSATDQRVSLLKATLTQIDTEIFNSDGYVEFLADVTHTGSGMPGFGDVVGVKISSLATGLMFNQTFTSITMASASIGRPVPEPSSIIALASTLVLGCCGLRRRGRAKRRR